MFKRWFGEKDTREVIMAPLHGEVVRIEEVPDPTFSKKMVGEGVAIIPKEGKVVSPVKGEVVQVFPTKHAVGLRSEKGVELLIHIGLETVFMQGEGFVAYVRAGDKVKVGDPLLEFSIDLVKEKAKSAITPIVIINPDRMDQIEMEWPKEAKMGETSIMKMKVK
ncbi:MULTISPECIES: PTS glucose transporter subunit IIA [Aneurinibacillus]|uniref:PTS glucose transporter subunit IIA n=1 Tax=Aneurinibacillus thermoaerophilus TaxID=143495 RepID=A0A1G7XM69_ANETH|nr:MULTISPECIES: PTS glucose transporter subunit IIA [Aneurinibacillus]AMA73635.1 PTS glucose transporter subunit IIA [Aneurinibacillus sp. XH2]MED0675034.1 PTS glucose transporter subunit IIA [Aneurinibacillus thermoaerophilus]MED0679564.1 PTS glucose transporter subunit IIA [Aneurinibacillus thermoaerophilus]MED0737437.1 PTS glucose transporter subunit IIA [Aneurinibacillus thermoaerophilus]MED0756286.1 PTS glucose transporter subunit IIA [Aneurinibacillus thermoaerophilus]